MPDSETTPALPILIVEDDAGLATLVAETLHAEGLRTVIFSAGRDALAWLEGNEAALLILDYTLTDMNGTQFLARAGAQVTARTPFIVVTGLGDERIAVDMMKRGARDYLVKGLSLLDVLPVTVRNVLSQVETERHLALARQSLENVEHRYQRLFEDATEGIAVADFETGELLECNNAFLDLTGYALDELVGRSQKMLHPPEEGDSPVSRDFALHQSEKQGQTLASRMVTKSGALKDVEIKANAVDIGGRRVMIAFFRDVTAQLRIQRERAVMLDLLKLMNEKTDTRELVRCVTATVCEYTGCEAAGIRLRKGNDYPYFETRGFPPEFVEAESTLCVVDINGQIARDELGHPLHECMCGNVLHGRFDPSLPFFTPKGSFWTNSTSELLATTTVKERQARTRNRCNDDGYESVALIPLCTGGGMIGLLQLNDRAKGRFTRQLIEFLEGVADQVAIALAQRTAEAALRESVKRFEDISNAAGEFIWETGLDQRITYISSRVFDILGYRPDEMLGRRSTEFTAADTAASITAAIAGHLRSGSKFMDYEHSALHKSGSTVWLSVTAIPIQDERGEVAGWRGVSVDITRRKQAETERLEMERRLLHAQKLESLGVLAGGIAHDFNNLLVAMLGNLDMALADISPVSPARESIFEALAAAKHAADLTRQMLAYSGRGTHVVSRISLNELVEENAHLFRATTAKTTTLNLDLAPGLPSTEADAAQLQQVVMNLITNASEALEGRPGVITLKTGACDCDAACLAHSRLDEKPPPGRFVFVEVTDTGCGMDKETQERIFDPFFTTKITGRGLGMSAVLGIVRGHKGALTVNSAPGAGATIRVLLPLITARDAAADNAPAAARAHADAGTLSGAILLVDDEPMVRNVCAKMLERCGLSVMKAASGAEAIALVREHHGRIDAVILDLSMPQMDGMTALREMRKVEPGIKVILSSGYSEQEALEHGREAGTVGFLQKPFVLDQLRNEVQRVLKGGGA